MKTKIIRVINMAAMLLALGLGGCGGTDSSNCVSGIASLCDKLNSSASASALGSNIVGATVTADGTVQVSMLDASGNITTSVSPNRPGTLQAVVKDIAGNSIPNAAVIFTTTDKTGVFVPASGTALTDAAGVARVGLPAGAQAGAFTVTAKTTLAGAAVTATVNYAVTEPNFSLNPMTLTLVDSNGTPIFAISPSRPGTLQALVRDSAGNAIPNATVIFTTTDKTGVFAPESGTALTDASGVARVGLSAGTQAGAFKVNVATTLGGVTATAKVDYSVTAPNFSLNPMTLTLVDSSGTPITAVSPGRAGTLQVALVNETGRAVPNVAITVTTTDKTVVLVPTSGSALTDANGIARVGVAAGTQAGAFVMSAAVTVAGVTSTASINYAVASPAFSASPLAVTLVDSSGVATASVSPTRPGTLLATLKDSNGALVPNIAFTFTTTDKTGVFLPTSGTALSDASGVARLGLPVGQQPGAFTVTASSTAGDKTYSGTVGYAVSFPTLTLSALTVAPASLSAGGTASLGVTLMNGAAAFTPAQSVSFTSDCVAAGKATISSPVTTVNGVATTSYTDKGCGGADRITASTSLGGATFSQTGTVTVLPAIAGQIAFVSALPQNIALKGTGGPGRQESSSVTFKVLDKNGNPVYGQGVDFELSTSVGGLTRSPASSTTGADGTVSTMVAAGTVNTPVRVIARIGATLSTLSDQLVVSTGVPDQNSFSLSTSIFNVEGMNHDGCDAPVGSTVRVSLADHFNNPAPDGTAVSFTAEGGTVDASCLTGLVNTTLTDGTVIRQKGVPGQCSVRFCAANPRPVDGRITILAYALGEESFTDTNGNNLYEAGEAFQDLGEPFRNDRAITNQNANANWGVVANSLIPLGPDDIWSTGNSARAAGETFIDSNASGAWDGSGDANFHGVLKALPDFNNQTTHVRGALVQVLSTSEANITALDPVPLTLNHCVDGTAFVNTPKTLRFAVRDGNMTVFNGNKAVNAPWLPFDLPGNILPAGTTISFSASNGTILSNASFIVPNTNEPSAAAWIYPVLIQSDATQTSSVDIPPLSCTNRVTSGLLTVKVTTPLGLITTQSYVIND